jgi:hypothetical protein
MGRTIYTERDIEEFAKRGVKELEVDDQVYITDVAREKMEALGIKAKMGPSQLTPPAPGSATAGPWNAALRTRHSALADSERQEVIEKVKSGVIARLGSQVDAALVDTIVRRVVSQL